MRTPHSKSHIWNCWGQRLSLVPSVSLVWVTLAYTVTDVSWYLLACDLHDEEQTVISLGLYGWILLLLLLLQMPW